MDLKNNKFSKIKFGEKEYYVIDFFEYEGERYYYIMENFYQEGKDKIEDYHDIVIEINFIYKTDNGEFSTVDDDNLWKKLLAESTKRIYLEKNKYFEGIYDSNK